MAPVSEPPSRSIETSGPSGPIELLPAAAARVNDVVTAIPSDRWNEPSPCTKWTVRDVLNHLTSEHLWVPHLLSGETVQAVGAQYEGDVLGADAVSAWTSAITASLMAWADLDTCERRVHTSMGQIPAHEYAHQMLIDLTVHGWDLAQGAHVGFEPHPAAVEQSLAYEAPRVGQSVVAGLFRPALPAVSSHPMDRLLALLGRDPSGSADAPDGRCEHDHLPLSP